MLFYISSFLLLTAFLFLYFFYIKPVKQMKWYKLKCEEAGYKVAMFPYAWFNSGDIKELQKNKPLKDTHYSFKRKYSEYDVIISNLLHIPAI